VADEGYDRYFDCLKRQAEQLVRRYWPAIQNVAELLRERETVGPDQVRAAIAAAEKPNERDAWIIRMSKAHAPDSTGS
jgi:hypothetical protein